MVLVFLVLVRESTKQVSLPFLPYTEDEWLALETRFVRLKEAIVYVSCTLRIILCCNRENGHESVTSSYLGKSASTRFFVPFD